MAIMISIQPQHCENIINLIKTLEIRKSCPKEWKDYLSGKTKVKPKAKKVYIYCTNSKKDICWYSLNSNKYFTTNKEKYDIEFAYLLNGSVVAEFTLNEVDFIKMPANLSQEFMDKSCLNGSQIMEYLGGDFYKDFYAWHIDDLKIYDVPKELGEFRKDLDCDDYPCNKGTIDCKYSYYDICEGCWACGIDFDGANCIYKQITRPPQSWCRCEELEEEDD